jgi:hypothetical protein
MVTDTENIKVLNVHSGAIHIEHKVSLKSRLAWFVMLYAAFPYLGDRNVFTIRLADLKKAVGYTGTNNKRFKEMLKELVTCPVEWNIFNKDEQNVWGISTLLAHCEIEQNKGICEYSFSYGLQKRFLNPSMYVKLNLLISKRFTSKNSLAIYCLALDYLHVKYNYGEKVLTVEEVRKYLGLDEEEYKLVGDLHRRIIQKAEEDINKDSDIQIEIKPIREENNKISAFKFCMSIKEDHLEFYKPRKTVEILDNRMPLFNEQKIPENVIELQVEIKDEKLLSFFSEHSISITTPAVQEKLRFIIEKLGRDKLENYLLFLVDYANREKQKGFIKTFSGFYINLIKDSSHLRNYFYHLELTDKKEKERQEKMQSNFELKLRARYNSFITDNFQAYLENNFEQYKSAFITAVNEITSSNNFILEHIIVNKHKGKIDKNLIKDITVMSNIFSHFDKFDYLPVNFYEWKEKFLNNGENIEIIQKFKEEVIKELA